MPLLVGIAEARCGPADLAAGRRTVALLLRDEQVRNPKFSSSLVQYQVASFRLGESRE